jgi:phosphoribosylformylglycinamidine synthase
MVNTIIISGYGINCERETAFAFDRARFTPEEICRTGIRNLLDRIDEKDKARITHINELVADPGQVDSCDILVWAGGFSMGDDTGSGLAFAHYAADRLGDALQRFIERDTLSLGICNGFQIMTHLGFFPIAHDGYGQPETALVFNSTARYRDLWVDLSIDKDTDMCAWTRGIDGLHLPIAHGEGRFYASESVLSRLKQSGQAVLRYTNPDGTPANGGPANPNGSLDDIAGICDPTGRFLGMMPHPERAILAIQQDSYTRDREIARRQGRDLPEETDCMRIFRNAVEYFDG